MSTNDLRTQNKFKSLHTTTGEFGIKRLENGAQKAWIWSNPTTDYAVDAYGTYTAVVQEQVDGQDNGHNWQNNLTGETKFSFNPEKMILDVQKDTGVEGIEADENAEAVYYNLQGVRVNNPENGLYIRVQGNSPPVPPCPSASVFK